MSDFQITLKDRSLERIEGADAYQQEGQMTTFFQTGSGRNTVDTWSTRIASFRTSEVVIIRRLDPMREPDTHVDDRSGARDADLHVPPMRDRGCGGLVRTVPLVSDRSAPAPRH